jgi:hypothetical protein
MEQQPLPRSAHLRWKIANGEHAEAANDDWVRHVLQHPSTEEPDDVEGRTRRWGYIRSARKYMRVVTEPDGEIVTAFFDRGYTRQRGKRGARQDKGKRP